MVVVPGVIPVTTPDPVPTVATEVVLLVHVPDPTLEFARPEVVPTQVAFKPVMVLGSGATMALSVWV